MATRRAPGHIVYQNNLSDLVDKVNSAKRALNDAMQDLDYNQWRRVQKSFKTWLRMNRLQAYREWHWIEEPIDLLSWTWAGHTTNTEHLRVGALIERQSARYQETENPGIAADIDRLKELPLDEIMMISRPIAPTPMANIRFANGVRRAVKSSLPLLLAHEPGKVKALRDFAPKERNKRSDRTTEIAPFIRDTHAYRLLPEYRFKLPFDPCSGRLVNENGELKIYRGRSKQANTIISCIHPNLQNVTELPRGPIEQPISLDIAGAHRMVAANRAFVFIQSPDTCWRVPLKEIKKLIGQ